MLARLCSLSSPLVPLSLLQPMMKPGGHGVIWKLMIDTGVFNWLAAQGREAAIVRQIRCVQLWPPSRGSGHQAWLLPTGWAQASARRAACSSLACLFPALTFPALTLFTHGPRSNPMAGTDNTLLALAGAGFPGRRSFGFASCDRVVGAAEGMNVLALERRLAEEDEGEGVPSLGSGSSSGDKGGASSAGAEPRHRYSYRVTNVEYTEFERLGIVDSSVDEASNHSVFPANTNVLYVGLPVSGAPGHACPGAAPGQ